MQATRIASRDKVAEGGFGNHRLLAYLLHVAQLFRAYQVIDGLHRGPILRRGIRIDWHVAEWSGSGWPVSIRQSPRRPVPQRAATDE